MRIKEWMNENGERCGWEDDQPGLSAGRSGSLNLLGETESTNPTRAPATERSGTPPPPAVHGPRPARLARGPDWQVWPFSGQTPSRAPRTFGRHGVNREA